MSTKETVFKINNRQVQLEELLDKACRISSKKLAAYFKQQGIVFERSLRINVLRSTLRIPVAIRRKENANLLDKVFQRLSWFAVFSETQLINYLAFFNHAPLTAEYVTALWKAVFLRLDSAKQVSFGRFLLDAGEDFWEIPDILEYDQKLDALFYDHTGQLDGLTSAQLRAVLCNSSTINEIKQIGEKYGVKIPGTVSKAELLEMFTQTAKARGLMTDELEKQLASATVKDIEQLSAQMGFGLSTKLNKEGIIEYLLKKAPQVSGFYSAPASEDEYNMQPPEDDVSDEEIAAYNRSSREFTVSSELEYLLYLPGEDLTEFFKQNGIRFERSMRMEVLQQVLSPQVAKRSREKTGGLDRTYARLQWFTDFGETQLINLLDFFNSNQLKVRFQLELLTQMVKSLTASGAYDDELTKLNALALRHVSQNGGKFCQIQQYNNALDEIFYDRPGQIDGLNPNTFRKVKYNSSTVKEIGEIATKFGVNVPDKMEREELAKLLINDLRKKGKYSRREEERVQKLPFRAMIGYAKTAGLDVELGLNKEELIEFVLKNASQTAGRYIQPKNLREFKEALPPPQADTARLLEQYSAQQKYTIVFERLGGEMLLDNEDGFIINPGEISDSSAFGQTSQLKDSPPRMEKEEVVEKQPIPAPAEDDAATQFEDSYESEGYIYIETGYVHPPQPESEKQAAATRDNETAVSEDADSIHGKSAAHTAEEDGYEIILPSAQGDRDYTLFYMDKEGNTVKRASAAQEGKVNVYYHSAPPLVSRQEDVDKLTQEIAQLREKYQELKTKLANQPECPQAAPAAQTTTAESPEIQTQTVVETAATANAEVIQTAQSVPLDDKPKTKKDKKNKRKKNKAIRAIVFTLLALVVLAIAYTVLTYFVNIDFLQPINNAINKLTVGGEGILSYLHSLLQKVFDKAPAM